MPRLAGFATDCTIRFDGERIPARRGEPVTAALLAAGSRPVSRSPKYHRPRDAFCLAGSCGGCLVRAGGLPSRRACRLPCRDGLEVESQNAFPAAGHDLLAAIDVMTPRGLDHHRLATWSGAANRAALAIARRLGGLGRLPERTALPSRGAAVEERWDALVVGAGPAGLGAAEALAEAGRRVLLAEQGLAPGGRLRAGLGGTGDPEPGWADAVCARVRHAGGEVALGTGVAGLWDEGAGPLALLLDEGSPERIRLVRAGRIVVCAGAHPQPLALAGGDRPGVHAARGLAILLAEHGVVPGERAAVVGEGEEAERFAARLAGARVAVERIPSASEGRVLGRRRVRGLAVPPRVVRCDLVAVATPLSPAVELPRALGAEAVFDAALGAFAVRAAADGSTGVPGLFAAGEITGPLDAARAAEAGRRAGRACRG